MADEYKIGDVTKFLKKIRRKRRQKQDDLEDTNPLALIFGKSPCSAFNQQHYQNYLSLSKEHGSTSEEQDDDDDDETAVFDKQEDSDVSHKESDEEDDEGDEDGDEDRDKDDGDEEEMVGMDEEDTSTKDETKLKEKKKKEKKQQSSIPRDKRTIFVGNISKETQKKALKKHFLEYGTIETVRMRSLAPAQQGMPQKVVGKTQDINSKRNSYNAYVVFTTVEAAQNAIEKNGTCLEGHHLRVDLTDTDEKIQEGDPKKTVFLGSLPYGINDEDVRRHFEDFGELESVRVVRDPATGMGKGFGFLVFKDPSSVALALKMNSQKLNGRKIRVKPIETKHKQNARPVTNNTNEAEQLSNAERRINQRSLKRLRYKKKIKSKKPQQAGPLDKVSKQQTKMGNKQFNRKQSEPGHKRKKEMA